MHTTSGLTEQNLNASEEFLRVTELPASAPQSGVAAPQPNHRGTLRSRIATLRKMGIPVIPLHPQSKEPATLHAAYDATTDRAVIAQWVKKFSPNNNAAAVARYDGFWFLDDDRGTLAEAYKIATGQELPYTFKVKTSRGFHYYFRHDEFSRLVRYGGKENSGVIETLEFKGEARCNYQYVVAPSSVHPSGAIYEVVIDTPPVAAPVALLEWLQSQYALSESLKPESEKPKSNGKSDSGFAKLFDAVGYRPLENRINALSDAGVHLEHPLKRGDVVPCPMPQHKHNDYTPCFGSIKNAPEMLKCLGNCQWSGDMVAACCQLDGGSSTHKTMYDCARAICKEEGLNFEEFFSKPIAVAEPIANAAYGVPPAEAVVPSNTDAPAKHKLDLIPLSDIESDVQEWLWSHRIPKGALTNLSGDADNGKSMVLYDILARISSGADFPDGAANPYGGKPQKVILLFSEGSLKTTVKPRMTVMGANMSNVLTLKSVSIKGEKDETKRQFYLKNDLDLLRKVLQQDPSIALIGFDPLTNYLGDDCNMNKSQDVRRVLTPLCEVAEEFGVTIIAIIHFSKNIDMNAIHRTGGAAALVEVPRAAWCCIKDDDPENAENFIFARIKNNLGKRTGGLSYRIEETFITIKGRQVSQPKLIWGARNDKSADDLLSMQNVPEMKGVAKAKAWLEELFKDGKARKSTWVYATALAQGITGDCIKKANRVLRTETKKDAERWYMRRRQGESVPWTYVNDLDDHSNEPVPAADDGEPL
jgi:hypothetical protein